MEITIAHLYPDLLNIYGDRGNIICLKKRCQWRGITVKVTPISLNDKLKVGKYDLYFGGGGQDRQQLIVAKDLQKKKKILKQEAKREIPMLTICGTYQLFGHYFKTHDGIKIPGISIFDAYTVASNKRKIGNITIQLNNGTMENLTKSLNHFPLSNFQLATLVGFENHSGNTFLATSYKPSSRAQAEGLQATSTTFPLGKVVRGFGNNGQDKTEGAVYRNVFGCYLHGPLLPKNPHFADMLIYLALKRKYKNVRLATLDDSLEWQTHKTAIKRA